MGGHTGGCVCRGARLPDILKANRQPPPGEELARAEIVLGIGTSHSPMLSLAPEHWDIRTDADRAAPAHPYRGETYSFEELKSVRDTARYTALDTLENREASYAACQRHLEALAAKLDEADPDVLIIVGDDQKEWFFDDVQPAFVIYHGSSIRARAVDAADPDLPPPMLPVACPIGRRRIPTIRSTGRRRNHHPANHRGPVRCHLVPAAARRCPWSAHHRARLRLHLPAAAERPAGPLRPSVDQYLFSAQPADRRAVLRARRLHRAGGQVLGSRRPRRRDRIRAA